MDGDAGRAVLVYITCADDEQARTLAHSALAKRLAACANILPGMRSLYWWQGELASATEVVVILKTSAERAAELADHIRALHPYTCPCILVIPIIGGNPHYLSWIGDEVRPGRPPQP